MIKRARSLTRFCSTNTHVTLKQKYDEHIKTGLLKYDPFQYGIIEKLNQFHTDIENHSRSTIKSSFLLRFLGIKASDNKEERVKGVYLYGGVGCGKTMLMDLCFSVTTRRQKKLRIHFNKFMLNLHDRIHKIKESNQLGDPIPIAAEQLLNEFEILFFDEFQVTDIVDAMLISRLFTELFRHGLVIFTTSNRPPDDLYKNGLQRLSFIPFINTLKEHCEVICLDSNVDYRRLSFPASGKLYYSKNEQVLFERFVDDLERRQQAPIESRTIYILGREVKLDRVCGRLLVTNFKFMCEQARGAIDYIELCKIFDIIILRDIPYIDILNPNHLRRFIFFVDAVYDKRVKLVCSGEAATPQLIFNFNEVKRVLEVNKGKKDSLATFEEELFAVDRTISRLSEMQSEIYWKVCENFRKEIIF